MCCGEAIKKAQDLYFNILKKTFDLNFMMSDILWLKVNF